MNSKEEKRVNHAYTESSENSVNLEQAQQMIEGYQSVNLDEASPAPVKVSFCEFVQGDDSGAYHIAFTEKIINTRVPLFAFNNMLANQKRMQRLRRKQLLATEQTTSDQEEEFDLLAEDTLPNFATLTDQAFKDIVNASEPAIVWQAREVLTIWKLTPGEGEMSLKKLMLGLTFEQIQGLFSRFFGAMLRQKQSKA